MAIRSWPWSSQPDEALEENLALPIPVHETVGDITLFERLSNIAEPRCHSPVWSTGVEALRGIRGASETVLVLRPVEFKWRENCYEGHPGSAIRADIERCSGAVGETPSYLWGAIPAPLGVRLRALALEHRRRGIALPEPLALDLVVRTRALAPSLPWPPGDTFVGWDGELWSSPSLKACFEWEEAELVGDERFDAFVVEDSRSFAELLSGELPPPFLDQMTLRSVEYREPREQLGWKPPPLPRLPPTTSAECRSIVEANLHGEELLERCERASERIGRASPATLAKYVQAALPDVFRRHVQLLSVAR